MTIRRMLLAFMAALLLALGPAGTPAFAHKGHHKKPVAEQQVAPPGVAAPATPPAATEAAAIDDQAEDRSDMTTMARLLDWLGRLHPIIVHFPIAFFPAALFTAIVGRRRPAFAAPVQFLVVAGGIIAPIAAILGWLDAMSADPDPLLTVHRWLGTSIGVAGLALAIFALRRPQAYRGRGMIAVLTIVTVAIVVQGWLGGALVHGADHLNW